MKNIEISPEVRAIAPDLRVIQIEAQVKNAPTTDDLWQELEVQAATIADKYEMPDINKRPGIAATRAAYKALGKEPNRYRPSAEAMCRRIVKGMGLYRTTVLIDLINLLSITSGYSIGGFDADKIVGETLTLGSGREGEEFNAIGRGPLNISCLPIFRDAKGGIGTPTSDEERTKLTDATSHLLMTVNVYGEEMPIDETIALAKRLLETYAGATAIEIRMI